MPKSKRPLFGGVVFLCWTPSTFFQVSFYGFKFGNLTGYGVVSLRNALAPENSLLGFCQFENLKFKNISPLDELVYLNACCKITYQVKITRCLKVPILSRLDKLVDPPLAENYYTTFSKNDFLCLKFKQVFKVTILRTPTFLCSKT